MTWLTTNLLEHTNQIIWSNAKLVGELNPILDHIWRDTDIPASMKQRGSHGSWPFWTLGSIPPCLWLSPSVLVSSFSFYDTKTSWFSSILGSPPTGSQNQHRLWISCTFLVWYWIAQVDGSLHVIKAEAVAPPMTWQYRTRRVKSLIEDHRQNLSVPSFFLLS